MIVMQIEVNSENLKERDQCADGTVILNKHWKNRMEGCGHDRNTSLQGPVVGCYPR